MCDWISGLLGSFVGGSLMLAGVFAKHWLDEKKQRETDKPRKQILLEMFSSMPPGTEWLKFETLQRVIGATREDTTRLLIEIGARGSRREADVWALKARKPISGSADEE